MYKTSLFEKFITLIMNKSRIYKYSLYSSLIVGILTYLFSFTNKLVNHDDIAMFFFYGQVATDHGRWGLDILNLFMPKYSMPWIYGMISLIFISIANCYIIKIFNITNRYLQILISGIIISFQSTVGMMSYMFLSYAYSLSFLFSVISTYYVVQDKLKYYIYALAYLVLSMGIYQAYFAIPVTFLIVYLLNKLLNGAIIKHLINEGIKYLLFIILSLSIYYSLTQLILYILNIEFNSYTSERLNNNWGLYPRFYWLIVNLIGCLKDGVYGFVNTILSKIIHLTFIIAITYSIIIRFIKFKEFKKVLFSVFFLFLLPIGINCLHLITPTGTHSLTLMSFISIYILMVVIIQNIYIQKRCKRTYDILLVLFTFLLFNNILIANKNHIKQYLQYEEAHAFYTGVVTNIEQTPGFDSNSKIALIGEVTNCVYDFSDFVYDDITGIPNPSLLNVYSRNNFIKLYIGFDVPFTSNEENDKIKESNIFKEMPLYPYYGSVKKIDNIIVVKFNE